MADPHATIPRARDLRFEDRSMRQRGRDIGEDYCLLRSDRDLPRKAGYPTTAREDPLRNGKMPVPTPSQLRLS